MCMSFLTPQVIKLGLPTITIDCSISNMHPNSYAFSRELIELKPDIVGISSWSQSWRWTKLTVSAVRDIYPDIPIVLGGPHITATCDRDGADYVLMGEAEYSLPALIVSLFDPNYKDKLSHVDGLRGLDLPNSSVPALIPDLDDLGLPAYRAMFLPEYQQSRYRYRNGEKRQAPILATRGCPYNCEFCLAPLLSGRKIRKHSIAYLQELLRHLQVDFDVTHFNIVDDNFTFYKDYAKEFCQMVLQHPDEFGAMTFATPNGIRVERSDLEMFQMMKRAGWSNIIFAPESGSQRMVDIMAKHLDLTVVSNRVEKAHRAGLEVEAFFILNYPGETETDVDETEKFIQSVPFDSISLHIFKPLPHTPIWRELVDSGKLSPEYVIGRYDEIDWLANGKTRADIARHIARYQKAAKRLERVA